MKISSAKMGRIRTSFVARNTTVGKANAVESISSIKRIQNSSYYSSENHLMYYDQFYDNLKELKKEYKRFYHDEQILENAILNFDDDNDELLSNMSKLVIKYNNAVNSLSSFDKAFGTNHVMKIENILKDYRGELEDLGIYVVEGNELIFNEEIFINRIQNSEKLLNLLFEPTKGIILKIYAVFRNIKLCKKDAIDKKFDNNDYTGMILDNKT